MKKSVLTLAVAGVLALPVVAQADTILYGSARVSIDYLDEQGGSSSWDVVNNDSRLGVLGSEDLGGGLSAIYQFEFGVDVTEGTSGFENNRPKFVGLKGGFGTVTVGTQDTPYYDVAGVTDIFNSAKTFGATAWLGGSFNGFDIFFDQVGSGRGTSFTRLDNTVLYTSPEFAGFSVSLMLAMSNRQIDAVVGDQRISVTRSFGWSDGVDIWNINAKYVNGPFSAGVSYVSLEGSSDRYSNVDLDLDQWVLGLGYSAGPFNVGFIYERGTYNEWGLFEPLLQSVGFETDTPWNAYLAGSYTFGNNVISAAYGQFNNGVSGNVPGISADDTINNFVLGYQYNFSRRTSIWVEYIGRDSDFLYGDQNAVSIGTRVDF